MALPDSLSTAGFHLLSDYRAAYSSALSKYVGDSAGYKAVAPLPDGNWAVIQLHEIVADLGGGSFSDVVGLDLIKVSEVGDIIGSSFYDMAPQGVTGWMQRSFGAVDAGAGRVRIFGRHGVTFPNFTVESWLADFSTATPFMVSYRSPQTSLKGNWVLGQGVYDAANNACIFGHSYDHTGTVEDAGIIVVAINATTGDIISQFEFDAKRVIDGNSKDWPSWVVGSQYGFGVASTELGDHLIHLHAATLAGGVLTHAEVGTMTVSTAGDYWQYSGNGTASNEYNTGLPTIYRHFPTGETVSVPGDPGLSWDWAYLGGQIAGTHTLSAINVHDYSTVSDTDPGGYKAPAIWQFGAADWTTVTAGYAQFTAPYPTGVTTNQFESVTNTTFAWSPYSNNGIFFMDSNWGQVSGDSNWLNYYLIIDAGLPAPPPTPVFSSVYTSTGIGRLILRKPVSTGAPVESDLTETPGAIGVEIPAVTPATGISIYPGEQLAFRLPHDGLVKKYGQPTDPGLSQTYRGFPRTPSLSVMADTLCSTAGEFLSGAREQPSNVDLGTDLRFFASDFTSDGRLPSSLGSAYAWEFQATGDVQKVAYSYRLVKEIFNFDALSFNAGYLDSDWPVSDLTSMTVSGAFIFRAPKGYTVFSGGGDPEWSMDMNLYTQVGFGEVSLLSRVSLATTQATPFYVTAVITPPLSTYYLSTGPGNTQSFTVKASVTDVVSTVMAIGKRTGKTPMARMEMLELSIDTHARTRDEVEELNATYGSVYG